MYNVLRNIKNGLGFFSFLLVMAATLIWVIVAFQKQSLGVGGWPDWLILVFSICTLMLTLFTYKDLGEIMSNGDNTSASKLYHSVFSSLTVFGYGGGILFHFKPVVAAFIVAISFVGKWASKRWLSPRNA